MSAPRLAQARIRIDSVGYSENYKILREELNKYINYMQPLSKDKGLISSLNFSLLCSLESLLSGAPSQLAASKKQDMYIVQLSNQLDRYNDVINSEEQRKEEEKALRAMLQEGMQFKSLAFFLIRVKNWLNEKAKPIPRLAMKMPGPFSYPFVSFLDDQSISAAAQTSTSHAVLFQNKNLINYVKNNKKIHNLFQHLVRGEVSKVEEILKKAEDNPEYLKVLLTAKHTITDRAGRQFDNITLFQLALWCLNKDMWEMLLKYFNKYLPEEAEAQYQAHNAEGQKCPQYVTEHGRYYNSESKEKGKEGIIVVLEACAETYENHVQLYASQEMSREHNVYRHGGEGRLSLKQADDKFHTEVSAAQHRIPEMKSQHNVDVKSFQGQPHYVPGFPAMARRRVTEAREKANEVRHLFQVKIKEFEALKVGFEKNLDSEVFASIVLGNS